MLVNQKHLNGGRSHNLERIPERIPSINLKVKSLLTSRGAEQFGEGCKAGYPTPLKDITIIQVYEAPLSTFVEKKNN